MKATDQASPIATRRRWPRVSLRLCLGAVTAIGLLLGIWVQRAERQRAVAEQIRAARGEVHYSDETGTMLGGLNLTLPERTWRQRMAPRNYRSSIVWVGFYREGSDPNAVLDEILTLPSLQGLELFIPADFTDSQLLWLQQMRSLDRLVIRSAQGQIPRERMRGVAVALPHTSIRWADGEQWFDSDELRK